MASKINALINRSWTKHDRASGTITDAKGRDYFDLLWYMQKGVQPKLEFTAFKSKKALWEAVDEKVKGVKVTSLKNDLQDFLENPADALDFSRNFQAGFAALRGKY